MHRGLLFSGGRIMDGITELVNNVAFPIAAFVMMFYTNTKTMEDMRNTINENTLIMTKILERLEAMTGSDDQ